MSTTAKYDRQSCQSLSAALGISLALVMQTAWRFGLLGFGIGELALLAVLVGSLLISLRVSEGGVRENWSLLAAVAVGLVVPVSTILSLKFFRVEVISVGSLAAFLLVALFLLAMRTGLFDLRTVALSVGYSIVVFAFVNYLVETGAWYSIRFTGGAKNPNQLALYVLVAISMLVLTDTYKRHWLLLIALIFLGILTLSDALYLSMVALAVPGIVHFVLRWSVSAAALLMLLGVVVVAAATPALLDFLSAADAGGGRLNLYQHGLEAWLSSAWSLLFGYGSGAFSGVNYVFEGSEAHNSIIDILTIGGLFLASAFLVPIFLVAVQSRRRTVLSVLVALLLFAQFHLVVRHPMFWLAWFTLVQFTSRRSGIGEVS